MRYETPQLDGPVQLYETPMLLDVAEISGAEAALDEAASWCVCVTSGSNDAAAAVDRIA